MDSINDKLSSGITADGDAALPPGNEYNSTVDPVEEDSLSDAIGDFISSGLPFVSYFQGTYILVDSGVSSFSTELYGKTITIDFSYLEDIFHNMGLVLIAISTIIAFFIIVKRG